MAAKRVAASPAGAHHTAFLPEKRRKGDEGFKLRARVGFFVMSRRIPPAPTFGMMVAAMYP